MIASFGDRATEDMFHGRNTHRMRAFPADILAPAIRKLDMINFAKNLSDLGSSPGNRLEQMRGNWRGYYSIRVNAQWRIVFRWTGDDAHDVTIVDYH